MTAAATKLPRFIECRACGAIKDVKTPSQQKRQQYCSRVCAGKQRRFTPAERDRGRTIGHANRRLRTLAKYQGWTPMQIARRAYQLGYHKGYRKAVSVYRRVERETGR